MISCDTNVLFQAICQELAFHEAAASLLESFRNDRHFVLCEQTLLETYCLCRNSTVLAKPLSAPEAVAVINALRSNPKWRIVDVPPRGEAMRKTWAAAAVPGFPARRVFDLRMAWTLIGNGVDTFYTRNTKDFEGCGFANLVNPFK